MSEIPQIDVQGAKELLEVRAEEGKQVGVLLGMLAQLRGDAAHSGEIGDGADAALLDKVAELVANVIDGRLRRGREPRPSRLSLP